MERVYLDALSSKVVKVKCLDDKGKPFGQNTSMIATIETTWFDKIQQVRRCNDFVTKLWTFWNMD